MELDRHRELENPLLQLFLNSCCSDTVFVTLLRIAVETAIIGVHKLLRTDGVPTSLTLLFLRWLTVSSVFSGRSVRTSYSCLLPSLISRVVCVDVKHHVSEPRSGVNREVELGCHSWTVRIVLVLSCSPTVACPDTVFVT